MDFDEIWTSQGYPQGIPRNFWGYPWLEPTPPGDRFIFLHGAMCLRNNLWLLERVFLKSADSSACWDQKPTYKDIEAIMAKSSLDTYPEVQPHRLQA